MSAVTMKRWVVGSIQPLKGKSGRGSFFVRIDSGFIAQHLALPIEAQNHGLGAIHSHGEVSDTAAIPPHGPIDSRGGRTHARNFVSIALKCLAADVGMTSAIRVLRAEQPRA